MTVTQSLLVAPLALAVLAGVAGMLADAFSTRRVAVIVVALGLLAAAGFAFWGTTEPTGRILDTFGAGGAISAIWGVIALTSGVAAFGGLADLSERKGGGGVAALMGLAAAGSMLLAASLDVLLSFIALETIAVCAYAMVLAARTPRSAEAGMKYVVQGAMATGLFLAGMAIHVGVVGGGTSYGDIRIGMPEFALPAMTATVFLLSAYAFKLGAVPFHGWAPDAFETAPPAGGAFMASAPKVAAAFGLSVLFIGTVEPYAIREIAVLNHMVLFAALAVGSILVGNLGALRQSSYLRMLGYSGIAQVGYALVGMTAASEALPAVSVLISGYAIAAVGAFLVAQWVTSKRPDWDGTIAGMAGIGRENPVVGVALVAIMLSLTGIPLTVGFWGKLYAFAFAVRAGMEWLALLGVIGSVISFGYYGAVLRSAFFESPDVAEDSPENGEIPVSSRSRLDRAAPAMVVLCALLVLVLGLLPFAVGLSPYLEFFALS